MEITIFSYFAEDSALILSEDGVHVLETKISYLSGTAGCGCADVVLFTKATLLYIKKNKLK